MDTGRHDVKEGCGSVTASRASRHDASRQEATNTAHTRGSHEADREADREPDGGSGMEKHSGEEEGVDDASGEEEEELPKPSGVSQGFFPPLAPLAASSHLLASLLTRQSLVVPPLAPPLSMSMGASDHSPSARLHRLVRKRRQDEMEGGEGDEEEEGREVVQHPFARQRLNKWKFQAVKTASVSPSSWREEEDDMLFELVQIYRPQQNRDWVDIALKLSKSPVSTGRTGEQCRLRWTRCLDPEINRGAWTEEEDRIILLKHKEVGNRWAKIAIELPGRYDLQVKSRFEHLAQTMTDAERSAAVANSPDTGENRHSVPPSVTVRRPPTNANAWLSFSESLDQWRSQLAVKDSGDNKQQQRQQRQQQQQQMSVHDLFNINSINKQLQQQQQQQQAAPKLRPPKGKGKSLLPRPPRADEGFLLGGGGQQTTGMCEQVSMRILQELLAGNGTGTRSST
ncbi:unnamed protein product [Vitrella brassicaformis CCMP3155]|uniref:Myb-like domain-containing protein n=1 Tax=Vitrella brassicaformis (strain CCMP3155) TaxID=1169540 RepID=A0A0G4EWR6_VITBC|nr:unnamed protein product [Vitrella brassicaformis CCMP3155]|eukprot:CEM03422.1 unnamed protein product [Vitrella brassicaformis CCMP3155]